MRKSFLVLIVGLALLLPEPGEGAITNDMNAHIVLGQLDFASGDINMGGGVDGRGLNTPHGVAVDPITNRVYVSDKKNNRVIWFKDIYTLINGGEAEGVLGQPDFYSSGGNCTAYNLAGPNGLALDKDGNLYVCDQWNNRVLKYDFPITSSESASLVIGQLDFETSNNGTAADMFCWPSEVAVDEAGNLYVVEPVTGLGDEGNSRVMVFTPPLSIGMAASIVLGQSDFDTVVYYDCSPTGLYGPRSIVVDSSGNVYVTDMFNNRALKYEAPLSSGMAATMVIGQTDLYSSGSGCTSSMLNYPYGIALDGEGNLYVSDTENNRVLRFSAPLTTGMEADLVLGQADFFSGDPNQGGSCAANTLNRPRGMDVDSEGNIYVIDTNNNRLLLYRKGFSPSAEVTREVPDGTKVYFSAGAVSVEFYVAIGLDPVGNPREVDPSKINEADGKVDPEILVSGSIREFTVYQLAATRITGNFQNTVIITIPYQDTNQDGIVDGTNIGERTLRIYYLDEENSEWVLVGGVVDTQNNTVSAEVSRFSVYRLMATSKTSESLDNVVVYPNPFKPNDGNDRTGTWSQGIIFGNLTSRATIKIYNITGELVRELEKLPEEGGQKVWDGNNEKGKKVASGIYVYLITNPQGDKKLGKLAVIK